MACLIGHRLTPAAVASLLVITLGTDTRAGHRLAGPSVECPALDAASGGQRDLAHVSLALFPANPQGDPSAVSRPQFPPSPGRDCNGEAAFFVRLVGKRGENLWQELRVGRAIGVLIETVSLQLDARQGLSCRVS